MQEIEMQKSSVFRNLSKVNVENFVKGKNGYKFLSWSHAVNQLLFYYPDATWKVREWNGLPYLKTEAGCFVEVSVTVEGITRSQLHPMLDFRNKPIKNPDAFQVNTSLQRSLAKAISLHGLGLYIYQGEDLPLSETEALAQAKEDLTILLKKHNKYSADAARAISNMNYDQLKLKIDEYENGILEN